MNEDWFELIANIGKFLSKITTVDKARDLFNSLDAFVSDSESVSELLDVLSYSLKDPSFKATLIESNIRLLEKLNIESDNTELLNMRNKLILEKQKIINSTVNDDNEFLLFPDGFSDLLTPPENNSSSDSQDWNNEYTGWHDEYDEYLEMTRRSDYNITCPEPDVFYEDSNDYSVNNEMPDENNTMFTEGGPVQLINSESVTPKTLGIFKHFLDQFVDGGHNISTINFSVDGDSGVHSDELATWVYYKDSKSIVANLKNIVDLGFYETMENEEYRAIYLGVKTAIWNNLLFGFYSRCHYAQADKLKGDKLDVDTEARDIEQQKAEQLAKDSIVAEVKKIDMEIDLGDTINGILKKVWEQKIKEVNALTRAIDESKVPEDKIATVKKYRHWLEVQTVMLDENLVWYQDYTPELDGRECSISKFKEFLAWLDGASLDDESWGFQSQGITQTVRTAGDTVIGDEPKDNKPAASPIDPDLDIPF